MIAHRMHRSRPILVGAAASLALSLPGCGGTEPATPPASTERHGVAAANAICGEYRSFVRAWAAQAGAKPSRQAVARLIAVKRSAARRARRALAAVAGQPGVRRYLDDVAAGERVRRAISGLGRAPARAADRARLLDQLHAAAARAYADGKALGLGECIGAPPRRATGG
jgi:hypothetical protein